MRWSRPGQARRPGRGGSGGRSPDLAAIGAALALVAWPWGAIGIPAGPVPPDAVAPARPFGVDRSYLERLERRLLQATQFAARQPSGPPLWTAARNAMSDLLTSEWRAGRLIGTRAEQAFSVRCDRTTMTEADLVTGRLVCLVGVATQRPAEFSVIRLVQPTARRRPAP
jgi:phage tail sheath protein FI